MERLLTTEEVAEYLRVDVVTVRRLVNRGDLTAYRIGSEYRFIPHELERFVKEQRVSGPEEVVETSEGVSQYPKDFYKQPGRFDRFTKRARKVLTLATEEAIQLQHNYIGTEHLLLGLISEGEGVAAKALDNLGVKLEEARRNVISIIERGGKQTVTPPIGLTPRAKKVIELAVDEARRLNHHYIGTEHMLLGMIREGEGVAAGVLNRMGVSLEAARSQVLQVLATKTKDIADEQAAPEQPPEEPS